MLIAWTPYYFARLSSSEEAPADEGHLLMRSGCLTKGLKHQNLTSILAAVLPPSSSSHPSPSPLLIYPVLFNEHNLRTFLQRCAISHPEFLRVNCADTCTPFSVL